MPQLQWHAQWFLGLMCRVEILINFPTVNALSQVQVFASTNKNVLFSHELQEEQQLGINVCQSYWMPHNACHEERRQIWYRRRNNSHYRLKLLYLLITKAM